MCFHNYFLSVVFAFRSFAVFTNRGSDAGGLGSGLQRGPNVLPPLLATGWRQRKPTETHQQKEVQRKRIKRAQGLRAHVGTRGRDFPSLASNRFESDRVVMKLEDTEAQIRAS